MKGGDDEGVAQLVTLALRGVPESSETWAAIRALAHRGGAAVFQRARVRQEFVEAAGLLGDVSLLPLLRALVGQREDDAPFHRALSRALEAPGP
jgi:hypothetical protein